MIRSYADHAANERTFLAWLRTGVAVIAFGFLIDRFDLFILTMSGTASATPEQKERIDALAPSIGTGVGEGFILVGIIFILAAMARFVRTGILLDDQKIHSPGIGMELSLSSILAILLVAATLPLVLPRLF